MQRPFTPLPQQRALVEWLQKEEKEVWKWFAEKEKSATDAEEVRLPNELRRRVRSCPGTLRVVPHQAGRRETDHRARPGQDGTGGGQQFHLNSIFLYLEAKLRQSTPNDDRLSTIYQSYYDQQRHALRMTDEQIEAVRMGE